ncbi:hypothetical protein GWE18_39150 [Bradyrhizobium sp. CSA112]|nr:hypothetical protein [Bradyrhizobium sp. CSA112]MDE5458678.1 hypothetical protein [Bradyrhizobium sp. CSA112]
MGFAPTASANGSPIGLKITSLDTELKRQGMDVIVLGTSEPDFGKPNQVK